MSHIVDPNQDSKANRNTFEDRAIQQLAALPIIEEQLHVDKVVVEAGVVHISKKVHQEGVTLEVPLIHEEHEVERIAINQFVDSAPAIRHEGATMIIPVLREELIVQKRMVLVEELRITKKLVQTKKQQEVTLRKEELVVERIAGNNPDSSQV